MSNGYQRFVDLTIAHIKNWNVSFEELNFTIRHNLALGHNTHKTKYLLQDNKFHDFIKSRFGERYTSKLTALAKI